MCGKVNELIYRGLFEFRVGDCAFLVVGGRVIVEHDNRVDFACVVYGWMSVLISPEQVVQGSDSNGIMVMIELEHLVGRGGEYVITYMNPLRTKGGINGSQVRVDQQGRLVVRYTVVPVVLFPLLGADDHGVVLDEDVLHGVACEAVVVVVVEDYALSVVAPDGVAFQDSVLAADQGYPGELGMEKGRISNRTVLEPAIELDAMPTE